jgi:hypothetical protein
MSLDRGADPGVSILETRRFQWTHPCSFQATVLSDAVGALSSSGFDHTPLPEVKSIRILHWLVPHEKCVCNLQNNNLTETRKRAKWPHGARIGWPFWPHG